MDFRIITQDQREALYKEVWEEPVITVAKRYGLSDNGLRKHCNRLGIPLPYSGYWARIRAGEKIPIPSLPKVTGELKDYIRNYVIKYRTDLEQLSDEELMSEEELNLLREETKVFLKEKCAQIKVKDQLKTPHSIITENIKEIKKREKRDKALAIVSSSSKRYMAIKSKYGDNKATLPIFVSESNIDRAYRIIDTIIKAIYDMEGWARIDENAEKDGACFVVMQTLFYFELGEETKKGRTSKEESEKPPKLKLSLTASCWFSDKYRGIMEYMDFDNKPLEEQVGKIIYEMFVVSSKVTALYEMGKREEKREEEEQKRQRRLKKMREGELEELKLLEHAASDWNKAQKIRRFTDCMEMKINDVTDAKKREILLKWLKWARDKADWLDPLTEKEDELLGKSKHIFESIEDIDF